VTARAGAEADEITIEVATAGTVTIDVTTTTPTAGVPVALSVTPATGTAPRVTIIWGDGEQTDLGVVSAARSVSHVYEEPGTYTITASATDNGETSETTEVVTVAALAGLTITPSPTTGTSDTTFTFTVVPTLTGGVPSDVTVQFGDGDSESLGAVATTTTVTHRYDSEGTYVARAIQTNASGTQVAATAAAITVTD
jgi:hypothetical protein